MHLQRLLLIQIIALLVCPSLAATSSSLALEGDADSPYPEKFCLLQKRSEALQSWKRSSRHVLNNSLSLTSSSSHPPHKNQEELTALQKQKRKLMKSHEMAMGLLLIGMVVIIMSIFYLVNYPDDDIKRATWQVLSSTLSIFNAILLFQAYKEGTSMLLNESEEAKEEHGPPSKRELILNMARFLIMYLFFNGTMFSLRKRAGVLKGFGILGAHVVGFAAIEAFGTLQQFKPFSESPGWSLIEGALTMALMLVGVFMFTFTREWMASNLQGQDWKNWRNCCAESENEGTGLALGFIFSQFIKFAIAGELAPVHGSPKGKSLFEVWLLVDASIVCLLLVVLVSYWLMSLPRRHARETAPHVSKRRAAHMFQSIAAMSMAWSLLYAGQWFFWRLAADFGEIDEMSTHMLMFLTFAVVAFVVIFLLDYLEDHDIADRRIVQVIISAIGLVVGLAWEACADYAIDGLLETVSEGKQRIGKPVVSLLLAVLVIPAWGMYILPEALKTEEEQSDSEAEAPKENIVAHKDTTATVERHRSLVPSLIHDIRAKFS